MNASTGLSQETFDAVLRAVNRLRFFEGDPDLFWRALTEVFTRIGDGMAGCCVLTEQAEGEARFRQRVYWPDQREVAPLFDGASQEIHELLEAVWEHGFASTEVTGLQNKTQGVFAGVKLLGSDAARPALFFLYREPADSTWLQEIQLYLRLFADTPFLYQSRKQDEADQPGFEAFADTLEILATFNRQKKFLGACMSLVNETAERMASDSVSIGWAKGDYVRVKSVSHTNKVEKRSDATRALEHIMEEAFDQDGTVSWPDLPGSISINRQHASYAKKNGLDSCISTVIRLDGEPVGVLTLQRSRGYPYSPQERQKLQLLASQIGRRLADLHRTDRWIGSRLLLSTRDMLAWVFGSEHTWIKLGAVTAAAALAFLCFWPWSYRIDAEVTLKAEQLAYLTTPMEGYIRDAPYSMGDEVAEGEIVIELDDQDLTLEELEAQANARRHQNDARIAERERRLVELAGAMARVEQAQAQIDIIRRRLDLTKIRAPFDAVIVEGELRDRIGSPVEKGESLVRLARLDQLYAELEIPEWAIDEVTPESIGEIAFTSRPEEAFAFNVSRIIPSSRTTEQGNVFLAEVSFNQDPESWWRPGMTGLAKIDAGKKPLIWIWTHRAIDYLRLRFWM